MAPQERGSHSACCDFPTKIRHTWFSAKKSYQSKKVVLVRHFAAFNLRRVSNNI